MAKTQRVLDPIHGLITFRAEDPVDQLAWDLINTREFQRLRRIRQLGFSEFVFPGATHTRFSHSIGVFHTARQLMEVIKRKQKNFDEDRALVALCAALIHDLGHGPFSHTFENVEKDRGKKKHHEEWTAELIKGATEVNAVLKKVRNRFSDDVAELLTQKEPKDIYAAIVSSQFDADRLDYMRRDRYMAGSGAGGFDFDWLVDCLEVGKITHSLGGEDDFVEVDGLYLNFKGLQAAEGYLLARKYLYLQVYMHKTTRAAEKMLGALLAAVAKAIKEGDDQSGLPARHALREFYKSESPSLEAYTGLDDMVVWGALPYLAESKIPIIRDLAIRIHTRRLYKCLDVGMLALKVRGDSLPRFRKRLADEVERLGLELGTTLLADRAKLSIYGDFNFDERGALQKVLIGDKDNKDDIATLSKTIAAVEDERVYRLYVPDEAAIERLRALWLEVVQ